MRVAQHALDRPTQLPYAARVLVKCEEIAFDGPKNLEYISIHNTREDPNSDMNWLQVTIRGW